MLLAYLKRILERERCLISQAIRNYTQDIKLYIKRADGKTSYYRDSVAYNLNWHDINDMGTHSLRYLKFCLDTHVIRDGGSKITS